MCIIEKSKKNLAKKVKLILSGTAEKIKIKISHDTIQRLNCVVHYLNMKIKGKWIEIIDFKLCSSLKLDGV